MSLRAPRRIATILAVPTALAAGVALVAPLAQAAPTAHEDNYKGSAFAVSAKVQLAGESLLDELLPSVVEFPEGATDNLLEIPVDGVLDLKVLDVGSELEDGTLVSQARVADLALLENVVTASVLEARCTAKDTDVEGDSQVLNLGLAGMKIPVDAGPNLEIEIPEELSTLLSGGITIDEQTELDDGGLRVRALHLNISVNLLAIPDALASVDALLRSAAEALKEGVETATGQSLDALLGELGVTSPDAAAPAAEADATKAEAKKADATKADRVESKGAQAAERQQVRAASVTPAQTAEAPAATGQVEVAEQIETSEAPATPADGDSVEFTESVEKDDGAEIDRDAAAEQVGTEQSETAQEDTALDPRAEYAAEADAESVPADATAPQASAAPAATDVAADEVPVAAPEQEQAKAKAEKSARPEAKTDRAALPQVLPDELPEDGLLGVQVIISQVECTGAEPPAKIQEEKDEPEKQALPKSGGNGPVAQNLALAALGLMVAGGSAVYVTRRRGRHAV